MVDTLTPEVFLTLIEGELPYACLDVRDPEEYRRAHIPGASLMPLGRLEDEMGLAVPCPNITVLVYDANDCWAALAASTLDNLGYRQVAVLDGGLKRWMALAYPTESSLQQPGALGPVRAGVCRGPTSATEFDWLPDTPASGADIGAALCIDAMRNSASAWTLIQRQMANGADRFALRPPPPERRAAFEACAARLAQQEGIRFLDISTLRLLLDRQDRAPVYLIDVRTEEEYGRGHIPGFWWFPRNQTRPYPDEAVVMQNCPLVFCCDHKARAAVAASWFGQMGVAEFYAVEGGTIAWEERGLTLERGRRPDTG